MSGPHRPDAGHSGFALARRPRRAFVAASLALVLGAASWARQGSAPGQGGAPAPAPTGEAISPPPLLETEIILIDGRRLTGQLVSQDEGTITLRVVGIDTPLSRKDVSRVRTLPDVESQYRTLRARVQDQDFVERLRLAEWLRAHQRYDLALVEIDGVLALDPPNPDARELRNFVAQQKSLAERPVERTRAPSEAGPKAQRPRNVFPLLTDEQCNLLRVYEIDLTSNPRISIPREAVTAFLDTYAGQEGVPSSREGRDAFHRRPATEILDRMFRLRARDLYAKVQVLDPPPALKRFRDDVHNEWLMNACATSACHGGQEAGGLYLANRAAASDRVVSTNFFILDRARTSSGKPLLDFANPAESPLLQLGLPSDASHIKHPDVAVGRTKQRWRPVFQSTDDPRFQRGVEWIRSLYQPHPDYPIDYTPPRPRGGPSAEPAPPPR